MDTIDEMQINIVKTRQNISDIDDMIATCNMKSKLELSESDIEILTKFNIIY